MADTSQRKARIRLGSGTSLVEKNKEGATIPHGNEVSQNGNNVIRSENITFDNAENFNQSESAYNSTANQTYNEAEKLLQALEKKKAMLSYTASFNSNEYTLDARTAIISELIANGIEQYLQDKTVYLSPVSIENGFIAQFIAPANNTGSVTVKIQKYDGTYHTALTAKKYDGTNLVNLVAGDIEQSQLYTLVIISGVLVVFGIQSNIFPYIELGSTSVPVTSYIDFHNMGNNTDYGARIQAVAGDGTGQVGGSVLRYEASRHNFNSNINIPNGTQGSHAVNLGQFSAVLTQNGYTKLPNGMIMQWGVITGLNTNTNITVTLPVVFPNSCLNVSATVVGSANGNAVCNVQAGVVSTSQIRIYNWGNLNGMTVCWQVIGY